MNALFLAGKAPMRCAAVLLALLTVAACSERPNTLQPAEAVARVMDENHKASEALVQAARDAASKAGDQAHDAATATREAIDAVMGPGNEARK